VLLAVAVTDGQAVAFGIATHLAAEVARGLVRGIVFAAVAASTVRVVVALDLDAFA